MRRAVQIIMALGSMIVLSGCVVIAGQSSQQLNTIGAVKLTTTACFSEQAGCSDKGNSDTGSGPGFQVLLGYRVPVDTSAPQMFNTSAGQPLSFSRDASYTSELERLAPAGPAQKWIGYRSSGLTSTPSPTFTVSPTFTLRQRPDGQPFAGPFSYRVVTGGRVTPSNPNAPLNCGSDLRGSQASKTTCLDSPAVTDLGTNLEQPTQDLGIIDDPTGHRVGKGRTAPVHFRLFWAGNGSGPSFALKAATDIPGAEAKPHPAELTPVPGAARVRVNLRVPPATELGEYDVTLIATLPSGQTRSRIHEVRIGRDNPECGSIKPTITGTQGADRLTGTSSRDVIAAYGGNDHIRGRASNDLICAGDGNDIVKGGRGNDRIAGRGGKDLLMGGRGNDLMIGGPGKDRFRH